LILGAVVTACSPPPKSTSLTIQFEHVIDDAPLKLLQSYDTRYGQALQYNELQYWISHLTLLRGDDEYLLTQHHYPVGVTPQSATTSIVVNDIPPGPYDGISFHLGLDASATSQTPLITVGASRPPLWSQEEGFVFFKASGEFSTAAGSGAFALNIANAVHAKRLRGTLKYPLQLSQGQSPRIRILADIERLFAGLDLNKSPVIAPSEAVDSMAGKVASNCGGLFWLVTESETVHMLSKSLNVSNDGERILAMDTTPPKLSEPFWEEGHALSSCQSSSGLPAQNPETCATPFSLDDTGNNEPGFLKIITQHNTRVRSSSPGVVDKVLFIEHNPTTHSDIHNIVIRPTHDSAFLLHYKNVKDVTVNRGDIVEPGTILGHAADSAVESIGYVKFGVERLQHVHQRLCPARFMTARLQALYEGTFSHRHSQSTEGWYSTLCQAPSLFCISGSCENSSDFVTSHGDIDSGRATYSSACAGCHGSKGEGGIASSLCVGDECSGQDCTSHDSLAKRIEEDMPPEGYCDPQCAADVAAFIEAEFPAR
jgi:hypothetical protein